MLAVRKGTEKQLWRMEAEIQRHGESDELCFSGVGKLERERESDLWL